MTGPNGFAAVSVVAMIPEAWALSVSRALGRTTVSATEAIKAFEGLNAAIEQVERMKPKKRRSFVMDLRAEKRKRRIRRKRERQNKRFR